MKKVIACLLAFVIVAGLFTGCMMTKEEFEQEGSALVVIVGRHANAHAYSEKELRNLLDDLVERSVRRYIDGEDYCTEVNVSIIVADGDPTRVPVTFDGEEVELYAQAKSIEKVMGKLEYLITDVKDFLMSDELRADDPEVDLLAAISEGTTILRESGAKELHMVIYDPGITTTGFLDMRQIDVQEGSVDDVLDKLPDGAFYNLEGINVTFAGLGNVCAGQTDLRRDSSFQNRMVNLWTAYFKRCKATLTSEIKFSSEGNNPLIHNETETDTYPLVSNVPFQLSEKLLEEAEEETEMPPKEIILNTLELGFKGDSAEFRDKEAAAKALNSYADTFAKLKANPEITIYVVGSRARTTPSDEAESDPLSEARANAVKDLIITQYDIPASQIVIINGGTHTFSWRNGNEFPKGTWESLDPVAQQRNRVVAIIPSTAESLVNELVEAGKIS